MLQRLYHDNTQLRLLLFAALLTALQLPAFAQENMRKAASGLHYSILQAGKGRLPVKGDRVAVLYTLRLAQNDSIIADYKDASNPFVFLFGEGAVLQGLNEAAGLLKPGGEIEVLIPPELGYGTRKVGKIPASSALHANLKLLSATPAFYSYDKKKEVALATGVTKYLIAKGKRKFPGRNDDVWLNFTGYYINENGNRQVFDQSPEGHPLSFQRNSGQLLPGLETAIASMSEDEKATFIIQPEAAFGNQQRGELPPNSTLYFDIELAGFKNPFFEISSADTMQLQGGLKIIPLKSGAGAHPAANDIVQLHYIAYFIDADSNKVIYDRTGNDQPYRLRVGNKNTIEGLRLALQQMRPGAAFRAIIPAALAYGEKTVGRIPTGSTIFYDVMMSDTMEPIRFLHGAKDSIVDKSGVVIYPFSDGKGKTIEDGNLVAVHFNGYYIDESGKEVIFESTPEKGKPFQFVLGKDAVLEGWRAAFKYLKEGQLVKIVIPAALAYGAKGVDQVIPPNTDIRFDLQVLKVMKQPAN